MNDAEFATPQQLAQHATWRNWQRIRATERSIKQMDRHKLDVASSFSLPFPIRLLVALTLRLFYCCSSASFVFSLFLTLWILSIPSGFLSSPRSFYPLISSSPFYKCYHFIQKYFHSHRIQRAHQTHDSHPTNVVLNKSAYFELHSRISNKSACVS